MKRHIVWYSPRIAISKKDPVVVFIPKKINNFFCAGKTYDDFLACFYRIQKDLEVIRSKKSKKLISKYKRELQTLNAA